MDSVSAACGRAAVIQTRTMSLIEAVSNAVAGYGIAVTTQALVFPAFGLRVSLADNLLTGSIFTAVSLARSYALRRVFECWRARKQESADH
jgi:hypothetical protein